LHGSFNLSSELFTWLADQLPQEDITSTPKFIAAVQALAQIVSNKHGRAFTLGLEPKDVELCVETLDYVS